MLALLLLSVTFLSTTIICDEQKKLNISEPLTLTISPKIWNLLETKAKIINDAVTSITFPGFSKKKRLVKYRLWDGRINHFSVKKSDASFQDMNNGVRISMKNIQFQASIRGRVEVRKKVFGKWRRILRMSGKIRAKSENANLEVKLVWNDFKFIPTVTMDSKIRVDFTRNLRKLNFLRKRVQKIVESKVNSEVPKKIVKAVEEQVNPRLQKLKQKIISMGYVHYDIEWTVQNNILRVAVKPKSGSGIVRSVKSIDNMLCVDANVASVINEVTSRSKRAAITNGIQFTCISPKFNCEGTFCSLCTDIDITPTSLGPVDKFHNCLPSFF